MIHYHGCPITPRPELLKLAGRFFCNSFASPNDTKCCHEIGQGNMLDNGAFTYWRQNRTPDWKKWAVWVEPWLDYHTTWAVIPDSVEGDVEENDLLLREYGSIGKNVAPVWHLHEPMSRLISLCENWERVCFGSSGEYAIVANERWHGRVREAFAAISDLNGRVPVWIHMLRGMSLSGSHYPFASVDSTDIGRNHHRQRNAVEMANRWDVVQNPARWVDPGKQLTIEEALCEKSSI